MMNLVFIAASTVLGFLSTMVNGWALAKLWGWFIVKAFPSLPVLTTKQGIGVVLTSVVMIIPILVALPAVIRTSGSGDSSFTETMSKAIGISIASMVVSGTQVLVGWVWLNWIM